jgi:hypothetical protein
MSATVDDLERALARLAAEQAPVDATAVLDELHHRHGRRRATRVALGTVAVAAVTVGIVVLAVGDDDGSTVVRTVPGASEATAGAGTEVAELPGDADREVFLRPDAPPADIEAVRAALLADPRVEAFHHLDHEEAYARFVDLFEDDNPQLVEFTTPESLPTSFVVALVGGADADAFADDLRALPSVHDVVAR